MLIRIFFINILQESKTRPNISLQAVVKYSVCYIISTWSPDHDHDVYNHHDIFHYQPLKLTTCIIITRDWTIKIILKLNEREVSQSSFIDMIYDYYRLPSLGYAGSQDLQNSLLIRIQIIYLVLTLQWDNLSSAKFRGDQREICVEIDLIEKEIKVHYWWIGDWSWCWNYISDIRPWALHTLA